MSRPEDNPKDEEQSPIAKSTHYYVHRHERHGRQAPLPKGRYTMICDVYECERARRIGESGTAYRDYALQEGKRVRTSIETHVVE